MRAGQSVPRGGVVGVGGVHQPPIAPGSCIRPSSAIRARLPRVYAAICSSSIRCLRLRESAWQCCWPRQTASDIRRSRDAELPRGNARRPGDGRAIAQFRILQSPFDRLGDQSAEQYEQCKRTVGLSVREFGAVSFGDNLGGVVYLGSGSGGQIWAPEDPPVKKKNQRFKEANSPRDFESYVLFLVVVGDLPECPSSWVRNPRRATGRMRTPYQTGQSDAAVTHPRKRTHP